MTKWIDRFADWYERQPTWAVVLLFPIVAPIALAGSIVALVVFFLFALPYLLMFRSRQPVESPAAKFSLAEVHEHAASLDRWFRDTLINQPDAVDCLGAGPDLAEQLVQLSSSQQLTREQAEQFAERVQHELKGYKGIPFYALHHLSRRLVELTNHQRAA